MAQATAESTLATTPCVCVCVPQMCLTLCDPMDHSPPGSSVHGFSREEYWSRWPFLSLGDLPDPGIEPTTLVSPALAGRFFTTEPPGKPSNRTMAAS